MFQKSGAVAAHEQWDDSPVSPLLMRRAVIRVLLFSHGHVIKTEKNFAVAPSAKGNRPSESGQAENERNEGHHYILKRYGRHAKGVPHERQSEKKEAEG